MSSPFFLIFIKIYRRKHTETDKKFCKVYKKGEFHRKNPEKPGQGLKILEKA